MNIFRLGNLRKLLRMLSSRECEFVKLAIIKTGLIKGAGGSFLEVDFLVVSKRGE